jgi:hypothetical protein
MTGMSAPLLRTMSLTCKLLLVRLLSTSENCEPRAPLRRGFLLATAREVRQSQKEGTAAGT